ncbi:MAG TPA: hypothetical protein PKW75_12625 [candidate division Zixibacteria bacterium]|nr:hypothetical protein [candidate division Zixibacteria bacterium]
MTTHAETADLQGGVLKSLVVDWLAGTAEISIDHTPSPEQIKQLVLRFSGLARLVVPREGEWRGEMGIARIHGPITLEHDRQHLRIEMQSGDVIELDYVSLVAEPASDFAQPSASPEPEHPNHHPEIPDLHDAPLRDVRLCWSEGTAEILIGPLISTSSAAFGAEYVALRFQGLRRFIYPRRLPWDYFNPDILVVLGPARVEGDAWHLRLAMQNGDVIEIDYGSMVAASSTKVPPPGV